MSSGRKSDPKGVSPTTTNRSLASRFPLPLKRRTKGIDLLEKVCDHINLVERDYFGLTYRDHEDIRVSASSGLLMS